jgi:hypothetical protein
MNVKIKDYFQSLTMDATLIFYLFLFLCVVLIIFFPLILIWNNDPFKKIILAPLVEEPLKLIGALTIWFAVFQTVTALKMKQWKISGSFLNHFAIYGLIAGIALGLGEGPLGNIFLHAASSVIGAIFIVFIFLKVKNKPWKIGYKLTPIVLSLSIPMSIHSVSNQFSSVYFVNVHPEFKYLVIIGRYFVDNTIITDSFRFDSLMIVIATFLLIIWYLYLFFQREKGDALKNIFNVRIIFAIGAIFGLLFILLRMLDFQFLITFYMIISATLSITIWYLYLFFQREKGNASKKIFSFRIIFAIGILFNLILTIFSMEDFLLVITYYLRPSVPINSILLLSRIVNDLFYPILFILISIAGLLLTKKSSEKSDKPKIKWGFRTLFGIGIIVVVYELSVVIQVVTKYSLGVNNFQIIVFGFVFPIYFILISIAGLLLTK